LLLVLGKVLLDPVDEILDGLARRTGVGLALRRRLGSPSGLVLLGDPSKVDLAAEMEGKKEDRSRRQRRIEGRGSSGWERVPLAAGIVDIIVDIVVLVVGLPVALPLAPALVNLAPALALPLLQLRLPFCGFARPRQIGSRRPRAALLLAGPASSSAIRGSARPRRVACSTVVASASGFGSTSGDGLGRPRGDGLPVGRRARRRLAWQLVAVRPRAHLSVSQSAHDQGTQQASGGDARVVIVAWLALGCASRSWTR
jgi:hypothetical protein